MSEFFLLFFARVVSTLFHPFLLFLPVPYILILHSTNDIAKAIKWSFFSWIFIFSIVVFIYYQVRKGKFVNFDVSNREARPLLFLFVGIVSLIFSTFLFILHGPLALVVITFGVLFGLAALDIINKYVKASIHVASVSSILVSFVILNGWQFLWVLLIIPLVAWSRVKLHRHSILETVVGALFGICLTLFIYAMIEYVFKM